MLPILTQSPRWKGKINSAKEIMTNDFVAKQELRTKPVGTLEKTA